MAKKKDDRYRGHFNIDPKSKGGRRSRKPISESQSCALAAGRKKWTPGCPSPNPTGRPRQHRESVDFFRGHDDEINRRIMETLRKEELTKSDEIRLKGLFQAKEFAYGKNPQSVMVTGLGSGDVTQAEAEGVSALLARARLEQLSSRQHTIEAKPGVFIADASGNVAAPLPESAPDPELDPAGANTPEAGANAPPEPAVVNATESVANATPAPKPPPLRIVPDTAAPSKPKAKKAPHPAPTQFAGFNEFLSEKATKEQFNDLAKRQEEARRQGRPGGQIPMSELQPDPQPRQEFVNFTLAGNGRIKRC